MTDWAVSSSLAELIRLKCTMLRKHDVTSRPLSSREKLLELAIHLASRMLETQLVTGAPGETPTPAKSSLCAGGCFGVGAPSEAVQLHQPGDGTAAPLPTC